MYILKHSKILMGLMALTACGGSGGPSVVENVRADGETAEEVITPRPATFGTILADGERLIAEYQPVIANDDFVSPDVLASAGTAEFVGGIAFSGSPTPVAVENILDDSYAISDMTVSIDLAADTISGTADNFFRLSDEKALEGVLALDGEIARSIDIESEFGIEGTLSGVLEDNDGNNGTVEMSALGDLYSSDGFGRGDFIFGDAVGVASFEGSEETQDVSAIFLVERE